MKKLTTLMAVLFLMACSKDEGLKEMQGKQETENFETEVRQGKFDDTNLGLYKGVFTTNDGGTRAEVRIEINGDETPVAVLTTPMGESLDAKASERLTKESVDGFIHFSSGDLSFDFKVGENGEHPSAENVQFKGAEGAILLAKQTSKAPVEAVTGTYVCVDCSGHPELGKDGVQTFNFLFTGTGEDAVVETQATLNNRTYGPGIALQNNCTEEGNFTTCTLTGGDAESEDDLSFFGNSGPVYLTGIHTYENSGEEECSSISGTFTYESSIFGTSELSFQSDEELNCEVPGFEPLVYEDFEDIEASVYRQVSESGEVLEDDLQNLEEGGFYGVFFDQTSSHLTYKGRLGDGYFAARNTANASVEANNLFLTFEDLPIEGVTLLDFSVFSATNNESTEGDWSQEAAAGVEYSFDGGATWLPALAMEAGPGENSDGKDFPYEDVNFDGIGDVAGVKLSDTFSHFSRQIETEGHSAVSIRIYIRNFSELEDIAFDNLLVTGK